LRIRATALKLRLAKEEGLNEVIVHEQLGNALDRLTRELFPNWKLATLPPQGAAVVADFIDGAREFFCYMRPLAKDPQRIVGGIVADGDER
jgi:hypothetical protein